MVVSIQMCPAVNVHPLEAPKACQRLIEEVKKLYTKRLANTNSHKSVLPSDTGEVIARNPDFNSTCTCVKIF
jgi:hypothetical protein